MNPICEGFELSKAIDVPKLGEKNAHRIPAGSQVLALSTNIVPIQHRIYLSFFIYIS